MSGFFSEEMLSRCGHLIQKVTEDFRWTWKPEYFCKDLSGTKVCFINKVREEHVQMIYPISMRDLVYEYVADTPMFLDIFFLHPPTTLCPHTRLVTILMRDTGALWVRESGHIPSSVPSPRQHAKIRIAYSFTLSNYLSSTND